jgi:hypothetical protein
MFAVEVMLEKELLVPSMSEMRSWLDQQRIEPISFRYVGSSSELTVRVGFKAEIEASAFAEHFGGALRHVEHAEMLGLL